MSSPGFFVEVFHRPRRVAFLVDPDDPSSESIFDEIVDFNVCSWGGRYNPVIPLVEGKITDDYWSLLRVVDPDLFYAHGDLASGVSERILRDFCPLHVFRHRRPRPNEPRSFSVGIEGQASILPVLARVGQRLPVYMRKPDPAVLVFDHNDARSISRFTRRNFGGNARLHIWCRDYSVPSQTVVPDDRAVMKAVAGNRNLFLPIDLCAEAPRDLMAAVQDRGVALTICYGDSPWNFIEYWNRVHFQRGALGIARSLAEVWLTPALFEDSEFYTCFLELLRRRAFFSNDRGRVRMVSYDQTPDQMRDATARLCKDFKWNMFPSEPARLVKGSLPKFDVQGAQSFPRPPSHQPKYEQLTGSGAFLRLDPSDGPRESEESWIASLVLENPEQERYFANKVGWWKLPARYGLAALFAPQSASRVQRNHLICAQISVNQQGVIINIPELASLFERLVLPAREPEWVRQLDPSAGPGPERNLYLRASDKGRYARGVLGLFESLRKAAYVFEHPFWRGVVESLSSPQASEHNKNKVRRELEEAGPEKLLQRAGIDDLVDVTIEIAQKTQRPPSCINFGDLLGRYRGYLAKLSTQERIAEVTQTVPSASPTDDKQVDKAAKGNLRNLLSELTARKFFMQGFEIQCSHCFTSLWYHVDDVRSTLSCRGCRKNLNLPAEIPWSYSLNELVSGAVRDQGVVPVLRTVYRLFEESRECFYFLPGIEVRRYNNESDSQVCELDLVWVRDGEFGVAEVKRSDKKFSLSDDLAQILSSALPDRYILASPEGQQEAMQRLAEQTRPRLDPRVMVEVWSQNDFSRAAYVGWNSFAYSLFP